MIPQADLFTRATGRFLRDGGVAQVSSYPNDLWMEAARAYAIRHAKTHGSVTADSIHWAIKEGELDVAPHPNCFGSIFRTCPELEFTGERIQSSRSDRHAGEIKIWRIRK